MRVTSANHAVELAEVSGGTYSVHVTQSYAFASGTSYALQVTASGSTITVSVNGVLEISYANAVNDLTATKVGLLLGAAGTSAACTWDNFVVSADNSGTVVERNADLPYGAFTVYDASWNVLSGGSAYSWVYQHQGLRYDGVSGTYINRDRIYDPSLSRFLQNDPKSFGAGDVNLYRAEGSRSSRRPAKAGL